MRNDPGRRWYLTVLTATCLALLIGCGEKQKPDSKYQDSSKTGNSFVEDREEEQPSQTTPSNARSQEPSAIILSSNVLFSAPGTYKSPHGRLYVEIKKKPEGGVGYTVWLKEQDTSVGQSGHSSPMSEKELVVCWDNKGQPWFYHPSQFVWYFRWGENELTHVFVGSGAKVRDNMPLAFRESLPENIDERAREATSNGKWNLPWDYPTKSERISEHSTGE